MYFHKAKGVWGAVTSSVDWCEANYVHSPFIAEFFNTLSSLALVFLGEFGVRMNHTTHWKQTMCFRMLSVVGVGSMLFHMTLKYHMQMLDELPMLWASALIISLCLEFHYKKLPAWVSPSLYAFTVLATLVTTFASGSVQVGVFRVTFDILGIVSSVIGVMSFSRLPAKSPMRGIGRLGAGVILLATLCWLVDIHRCKELSGLYINPQLHAVWHILVAFGVYHIMLLYVYLHKSKFDPFSSSLHYRWGFIPYLKRSSLIRRK
ncbi:hypothetical protein DSO57_1001901 [Entomophthora muscae]|uniref:Uncharacterized protein n=1 Tax=Entomophthora muscae TaxID=34485 RepID=A0ACC2UHR1_9FUNG|nr:hypothetical protein DSO57_1001901 [Entomophthora muscae]